ncbi:hypothetical protein NT2_05_02500 [Caenibius tardaugens NBRC 16725]|uniref:Anti-sigma factor n=1 Tax=Caenibius tardaugens NBRC 16725 TaxID=1219035 RepID=U2YL62_9SPHN|nr:hypothetical protein [Caenibius tardaugens]AZI36670.1 anti-sigma factor [Caenibius tardaugens NBRC 16725]GAD49330.1 hypothetical protein NT2_05_02500 [Caenibius tardaugens NBRC 16725]
MADLTDPITEADLCAYVDDELDMARKVEVAGYLAQHPDAAAAVMADIRVRDTLRLAAVGSRPARSDVLESARQLDRKFARARLLAAIPKVAVASLAGLCLFLAQDEIMEIMAPPATAAVPAFVSEAVDTHKVARLRVAMPSETKDVKLDHVAIAQATKIVFPEPSAGWRVLDNRLVPSDDGPGLEISFDTGDGKPLTFFAVPTTADGPSIPETIEMDGASVAYWRSSGMGYVLAGEVAPQQLHRLAADFADNTIE